MRAALHAIAAVALLAGPTGASGCFKSLFEKKSTVRPKQSPSACTGSGGPTETPSPVSEIAQLPQEDGWDQRLEETSEFYRNLSLKLFESHNTHFARTGDGAGEASAASALHVSDTKLGSEIAAKRGSADRTPWLGTIAEEDPHWAALSDCSMENEATPERVRPMKFTPLKDDGAG